MKALFFFLFLVFSFSAISQDDGWDLSKESGDTKVYTRKKDGEKFKEIKILTRHQTTLNAIMAAFDDTEGHKEWVFKTPESYTVERVNDNTLIYYVKSDLPFPVSDRDLVIKYEWTQNPETKVIVTESVGVVGKVDEDDSNIRVKDFLSNYTLTPQADGWIDIEYYAKMDPAGSLPAWLVNMAVTKGPIKTMENLFKLLDEGRYDNIQVEGVSELQN
ncbi:START domain-containing protein [Saprospiraceae bacterium]|nr:START domain-containing protein [Saprospiraceae bacterium]